MGDIQIVRVEGGGVEAAAQIGVAVLVGLHLTIGHLGVDLHVCFTHRFGGRLPFARFAISQRSLARGAESLSHARPTELPQQVIERDCGFDGPLLAATVSLVVRRVVLAFRLTLPSLTGGASRAANSLDIAAASVG